MKQRPK